MPKTDYLPYYDLENYLFDVVRPRFHSRGYLSAFDFFCIIIWKANRAKTVTAKRLLDKQFSSLDDAVRELTEGIAQHATGKERFAYLWNMWGFRLPMGTAILTVLYPDEFTIYDRRVCDTLGEFHDLANRTNIEAAWNGYQEFVLAVRTSAPESLSLRDKDRYLWAKSFHDDLVHDIATSFRTENQPSIRRSQSTRERE